MKKFIIFSIIYLIFFSSVVSAQEVYNQTVSQDLFIENSRFQGVSEEKSGALDFQNASLEEALDTATARTGTVYIVEGLSSGFLSVHLDVPVTDKDLLDLIKGTFSVVFQGEAPAVTVSALPEDQLLGAERIGKVVPLKHTTVQAIVDVLKDKITPRGKVLGDKKNQQVVVWDERANIARLQSIIKQNDVALETEVFTLVHRSVASLRKDIEKLVGEGGGQVRFDDKMKTIVVTDTAARIEKIRTFLKKEDKPKDVILHASIFRVQLNEEHQNGVDWEAIVGDYRYVPWAGVEEPDGSAGLGMHIGKLNSEDYSVLMDALDAVGHVVHLISPDIKLASGVEKTVVLDTNDPFCPRMPSSNEETQLPILLDPQGFQMQIKLAVYENSHGETLSIFPRLHWMFPEEAGPGDEIFTAKDPEKITLSQGDHLIFGGLIRGESVASTRKVPLLGDLPFVGGAFRRERSHQEHVEYMVFFSLEDKSSTE